MGVLLMHGMSNQNVRNAAVAMLDANLLDEFWTSIARPESAAIDRFLPNRLQSELKRRALSEELLGKTHTRPALELARLLAIRVGAKNLVRHETGRFSVDRVVQRLDRHVAQRLRSRPFDAVYGYEDGVLASFQSAQDRGVKRLYELPIGYWRMGRQIFEEEAARQPEWALTLEGLSDSPDKLERKDLEIGLADLVIVPSPFVADSLKLCPTLAAPVRTVPYGCPEPGPDPLPGDSASLRLLFVGSLGARKGLPYLFDAVQGENADLTLLGSMPSNPPGALVKALERHRYLGSVPRGEVLQTMRESEVFVFPTLFEGLSLSLLEAMAQGLVPITTENSGAGGLIRDGENGFLVPIRSAEAIRERIRLLSNDRDRLLAMRRAARETACRHRWDTYRRLLIEAIRPYCGAGA